jgi:hypothetical protein
MIFKIIKHYHNQHCRKEKNRKEKISIVVVDWWTNFGTAERIQEFFDKRRLD